MTTIRDALKSAAGELAAAGIEGARLDARLLLGHALGREVWPHDETLIDGDALKAFRDTLGRRIAREPVSRILGRRGFWTLELEVTDATLDPRPDTETLVEAVLEAFADRAPPVRVLDLGTGTGCILLATLVEFRDAHGVGVDLSCPAVDVARANAAANGLSERATFLAGDWSDLSQIGFDLIISNPPYIAAGEIAGLAPEVREHDPMTALVAGADGLDAYRSLAPVIAGSLAPGGTAILELGLGQGDAVASIMARFGLCDRTRKRDLAGIERALVLEWNDTRSVIP